MEKPVTLDGYDAEHTVDCEHGALVMLELLADAPHIAGGRVQPLPTDGAISALNIPHSSIVFDLYQVKEIPAELLDGNGIASEQVKHANLASFTCLKALAFDQRCGSPRTAAETCRSRCASPGDPSTPDRRS